MGEVPTGQVCSSLAEKRVFDVVLGTNTALAPLDWNIKSILGNTLSPIVSY